MLPRKISPQRIVDLGCGTGHLLDRLQRRFPEARLHGIDFDPRRVEQASRRFASSTRTDIIGSEIEAFLLANSSPLDLIVSNFALHWSSNPESLFHAISETLSEGGHFAMSVPVRGSLTTIHPPMRRLGISVPITFFSQTYWEKQLGGKLEIIEARLIDLIHYYPLAHQALAAVHRTGLPSRRSDKNPLQSSTTMRRLLEAIQEQKQDGGIPVGYRTWQAVARKRP